MGYTINVIRDSDNTIIKTFNLTDAQILALKDSIIGDTGILEYLKGCIQGVIHKCTKNMRRRWELVLKQEYEFLPTDDTAFINLTVSNPNYQDAEARNE